MMTRFKFVALISLATLSASADKAHEIFNANKDVVLSQSLTTISNITYSVGRASSSANLGTAVGYAKAVEAAKLNLVDRYKASAPWPAGITQAEKEAAWLEFLSQYKTRFFVIGMQRIYSTKLTAENYLVVLSFPASQVQSAAKPTLQELQSAVSVVRERKRKAAAPQKSQHNPEKPSDAKNGVKINENFDNNLML